MLTYKWMSKLLLAGLFFFALITGTAQTQSPSPQPAEKAAPDFSGMYTFLRDGEFVQLSVESQGRVTGFVSCYSDPENQSGEFLDQFFKEGKLDENRLMFLTETVHGRFFEFRGIVERGAGKNPGDEAYYVLKGTLTENTVDAAKKTTSHATEVALKAFPKDLGSDPATKK
jgi:hypothetical protein